jgi:hypothetical protein
MNAKVQMSVFIEINRNVRLQLVSTWQTVDLFRDDVVLDFALAQHLCLFQRHLQLLDLRLERFMFTIYHNILIVSRPIREPHKHAIVFIAHTKMFPLPLILLHLSCLRLTNHRALLHEQLERRQFDQEPLPRILHRARPPRAVEHRHNRCMRVRGVVVELLDDPFERPLVQNYPGQDYLVWCL